MRSVAADPFAPAQANRPRRRLPLMPSPGCSAIRRSPPGMPRAAAFPRARGPADGGSPGRGRRQSTTPDRRYRALRQAAVRPRSACRSCRRRRHRRGQALQGAAVLQHDAAAEQEAARHHLDRRHGEAERARAGDDQHRDGRVSAMCQPPPTPASRLRLRAPAGGRTAHRGARRGRRGGRMGWRNAPPPPSAGRSRRAACRRPSP
jgi:hypothetical protein